MVEWWHTGTLRVENIYMYIYMVFLLKKSEKLMKKG